MSDVEVEEKSSRALIGKLDDLNFPTWSIRMRTYLKSKDLWGVITEEGVNASSKKKIKLTANILISHLSEVALQAVVTIKNEDKPKQIWDAIFNQYASSLVNNKAHIWLKFMQYKYGGSLKDYLIDCQKMIQEFVIVNLGIPDDIISIFVLAKLTRDYWNVVNNIIMNELIIFFPSRTLQKLQELVYMKETQAIATTSNASTSKNKVNVKMEKEAATAFKSEAADKSKKPKLAHPCSPGKHNPLVYHPAWRCFNLTAAQRDALRPADPEAHLVLTEVLDDFHDDDVSVEDNFDIVEATAFIISSSKCVHFSYVDIKIFTGNQNQPRVTATAVSKIVILDDSGARVELNH
ncbi:hypothetical protein PTTG_28586 [Puccinia triticina 1-1 BBBD Race 1]|uniref:DUF4219 domain-containing protein n=1 Tax=Puccinia triticina (isolate 1-1 / race 1 (BBBD)) TaxID=630390 RepID=A0A180GBA5_PUCT1|nr:hypothetical protein PTTG_28586 [Puccinia triticina 1-1 BBBD Race 1]